MIKAIVILALGFVVISNLSSCSKTETNTVTVFDTAYVPVHDTVGPAMLRFVGVLPNSWGVAQYIRPTMDGPNSVTIKSGIQRFPQNYIPVSSNTPLKYYLINTQNTTFFDSLPLPGLRPNSITTCVLFNDQNGLQFAIANDSQKVRPAPKGFCYLRLINDITDYHNGDYFYVSVDTVADTTVQVGSPEVSEYGLVPAGSHTIIIHAGEDKPGGY